MVGPSTWGLVAENLRRGGRKVTVPTLVGALTGRPPLYPAVAHALAAALPASEARSVVLVVHSGAGSLVPSVVDEVPSLIKSVIFVDATLPHPGRRWIDTVPAEMADELRGMAGPDAVTDPAVVAAAVAGMADAW